MIEALKTRLAVIPYHRLTRTNITLTRAVAVKAISSFAVAIYAIFFLAPVL